MNTTTEALHMARDALRRLYDYADALECRHEDTYRVGAIWTICRDCSRKWADDRHPFKTWKEPAEFAAAGAAIAAIDALAQQASVPSAEPDGWRPAVKCAPPQHFNAGKPDLRTIDYWNDQGCGIEYCYTGAAPLMANGLTEAETAATASVAGLGEHVPVSAEQEAAVDAKLDMVTLPTIRIDRATHAALQEAAAARGLVVQAIVRERLAPYAIPGAAPQAAPAGHVALPTTADEAAGMALVGTAWLREHAPERLKDSAPQAAPVSAALVHAKSLCPRLRQMAADESLPGHWRIAVDQAVEWIECAEAVGVRQERRIMDLERASAPAVAAPAAQPAPIGVEAVAEVREDDDGLYLDWLVEGGIAAMEKGCILVMPHSPITDDDGSGEVYSAAPLPAPVIYTPGEWFTAQTADDLQRFYLSRLPAIREASQAHGYAIGLHGSTRRDLDLIAAPWRDGASDADTLAHAIAQAACGIDRAGAYEWERKPAGRIATSLPICWPAWHCPPGAGHLDLSVMPSAAPLPAREPLSLEQINRIELATEWPAESLRNIGPRAWGQLLACAVRAVEAAHGITLAAAPAAKENGNV